MFGGKLFCSKIRKILNRKRQLRIIITSNFSDIIQRKKFVGGILDIIKIYIFIQFLLFDRFVIIHENRIQGSIAFTDKCFQVSRLIGTIDYDWRDSRFVDFNKILSNSVSLENSHIVILIVGICKFNKLFFSDFCKLIVKLKFSYPIRFFNESIQKRKGSEITLIPLNPLQFQIINSCLQQPIIKLPFFNLFDFGKEQITNLFQFLSQTRLAKKEMIAIISFEITGTSGLQYFLLLVQIKVDQSRY